MDELCLTHHRTTKIDKVIPLINSSNNKHLQELQATVNLPSIPKITEKIFFNRLIDYINKFDILNVNYYGFRQIHSTLMKSLELEVKKKYRTSVDKGEYSRGPFLDVAKASEPHNSVERT